MKENKLVNNFPFVTYSKKEIHPQVALTRSSKFYAWLNKRRTVRNFSSAHVQKNIIENVLLAASSAPSGAHKQPWTFCVVTNSDLKKQIRETAEKEEFDNYNGRMSDEWLEDLKPFQTDWHKQFLEDAPCLIVVFKRSYEVINGKKKNSYYAVESCGIAVGFLLAAIHYAGLVALTHTPSPMNFLGKLLNRPENEKPFLLIPVGYPKKKSWVPDIKRKSLDEISVWYE